MKRTALFSILFLVSAACDAAPPAEAPVEPPQWVKEAQERSEANAAATAGALPEPDVEQVVDKPLLWSVKSPSGAQSHVLGTYHVGTDFQGLPALPDALRTAFEQCSVVVLEADTGTPPVEEVGKYLLLPAPKTLKSMMKPDLWDVLVEQSGMPPQQLERVRPHVAVSALVQKWTPDVGVRGMDGRFVILARAHDKKLTYLETPVQQLEMLSETITVAMLNEMVQDVAGQQAKLEEMRLAFVAGDAEALEKVTFDPEQMRAYPGFHEAVFWKRNEAWIPLLEPLLEAGGAFVAVGAGHLIGQRSVIALLREGGYEVERLEP